MTRGTELTADKRVVVTGASSGIGAATVRDLRVRGWEVVAVARRADRLAELAAETGAHAFPADLTQPADIDRLRDFAAGLGPIDAIVNNAGGAFGMASVWESDVEDWRRMYEINVIAVKRMITAFLPLLRETARSTGSADILTVTSIAGHVVSENGGGYNAAKFAAHALMAALRLELAGEPIRVIEIAPGMVKTEEFLLTRFEGDAARRDAVYDGVPDPLTAEDVAVQIVHALGLPGHVDLDLVIMKPVSQPATFKVVRQPLAVRDS
jgi:NADP-dependent 3-hydroxy acid dehydrogenase YdfG